VRGRYGNVRKVKIDGHTFDSGREAQRYLELKLLQKARKVTGLVVHPRIPIIFGGRPVLLRSRGYPNGRRLTYVADFEYLTAGQVVIEDVKMQSGFRTEIYKIKRALVEHMGIKILET
jgi:hypothetical protein